MSPHWNGKSGLNLSFWRTRTNIFRTISFDDMRTKATATAMVWFFENILGQVPENSGSFRKVCVIVVIVFLLIGVNICLLISPITSSLVLGQTCLFFIISRQAIQNRISIHWLGHRYCFTSSARICDSKHFNKYCLYICSGYNTWLSHLYSVSGLRSSQKGQISELWIIYTSTILKIKGELIFQDSSHCKQHSNISTRIRGLSTRKRSLNLYTWWRPDTEMLSALLVFYAGSPPVDSPHKWSVC